MTSSYLEISVALNGLGEYEKALEYNLKALKIRLKIYNNEENARIANCHYYIGNTFNGLKDYEKSLEHHQKGLAIRRKVSGEESCDVAESYEGLRYYPKEFG